MTHKFHPANKAKLDSPERRRILPPEDILLHTGLGSGHTMIDIGAGTGYFTIPASKIVGITGRVIAVDTSAEMIRELEIRAAASGAENIDIRLAEEYNPKIEPDRGDYVLLCAVLHEIEDKALFLKKTADVMNPQAVIVIVEWNSKHQDMGPPLKDRIDSSNVMRLLEDQDLTDIASSSYNDYFYIVTARARDAG